MIPNDGGGRRPLRQASLPLSQRLWADINGETTSANTRNSSMNRSILAFFSIDCDGHHSQGPRNRIFEWCELGSRSVQGMRRFGRGGRSVTRDEDSAYPRLGLGAKRGPRADLPRRGDERGACDFPRARAPRSLSYPCTQWRRNSICMRPWTRWGPAGYRTVRPARGGAPARTKPDSAPRLAGLWAPRFPDAFAFGPCRARHRLYAMGPDIVRMQDCPGPVRFRSTRERRAKARSRRGRPWLQLLSVAPVFFDTSATILDTTASISASVSVRSRGCKVT